MRIEVRETWARTSDGQPLYVEDSGAGSPVILCCNGIGVSTFFWKYLREHFAQEARLITWDYRGHGRSPVPDDLSTMTIAQMADDAVAVMDHLGIDEAVMVGHSMGCQVILEAWRRQPRRVQGLVPMLGTYGRPIRTFLGCSGLEELFHKVYPYAMKLAGPIGKANMLLMRGRLPFEFARRTGLINPRLAKAADMDAYFEHLRRLDLRVFLSLMADMAIHDTGDVLGDIDVPTLIIGGERDLFTPVWISREMQARIPDAELLVIPDGSHAALIEQPILINLALTDFFVRWGILAPRPVRPVRRAVNGAAESKPVAASRLRPKASKAAAKTRAKAQAKSKPAAKGAPAQRKVGG